MQQLLYQQIWLIKWIAMTEANTYLSLSSQIRTPMFMEWFMHRIVNCGIIKALIVVWEQKNKLHQPPELTCDTIMNPMDRPIYVPCTLYITKQLLTLNKFTALNIDTNLLVCSKISLIMNFSWMWNGLNKETQDSQTVYELTMNTVWNMILPSSCCDWTYMLYFISLINNFNPHIALYYTILSSAKSCSCTIHVF